MGVPAGLTVVKLGGSHAFSMHLKGWLDTLASCAGRVVVVPGGGPFADMVRAAQPKMGFDDRAAHHMALLAMEQYGCALASMNGALSLADTVTAIHDMAREGRVPVWCPVRIVLGAADIPCSWDVTADSLAAWLASAIGAKRVLLVKHFAERAGHVLAKDLVARGTVDPLFPSFLGVSGAAAYIINEPDHAAAVASIRGGPMAGSRIDLH